jgi:hypothetical protein
MAKHDRVVTSLIHEKAQSEPQKGTKKTLLSTHPLFVPLRGSSSDMRIGFKSLR